MNLKKWNTILFGMMFPIMTFAESIYLNEIGDKRYHNERLNYGQNINFKEQEVSLPAVPNTKQGQWINLYIDEAYQGQAQILLDSIVLAPDGSIRYILNAQSIQGGHNISAEGIVCITGEVLFTSATSKYKTFAYADLYNQQWIMARQSEWKEIDPQLNRSAQIRRVLYDAFCTSQKFTSSEEIRDQLKKNNIRSNKNW